jgi:exoribonuclease R
MTYAEAQEIIESNSFNIIDFALRHSLEIDEAEQIVNKVRVLKSIAFARRKVRKSQDVLDRNEVTFDLDKDNIPIRVGVKKRYDS